MATKTRAKPSRRPVAGAAKGYLGRSAARAKRGYAKTMRKHPFLGILLQVLLGAVAVVALILGVVLESSLYYLVMALGGLGALAIRRAQQMERTRHGVPPKPTASGPRKPTAPPPPSSGQKPASGGLKCTATGRTLEGDNPCDCHSRHVRQQSNADRLGYPLGHPYGKAKAK